MKWIRLKRKNILGEAGFTMIELVVYMGIFSILIVILTSVFSSILDTQLSTESTLGVDENQRYVIARLTYDISHAQNIITPATAGATTSNLQITVNNINYSYSLDSNGNLQITDTTNNKGPYNLNDYDASLSNLKFTRIGTAGGKNTIQLSFTMKSITTDHNTAKTESFQTTVGTR